MGQEEGWWSLSPAQEGMGSEVIPPPTPRRLDHKGQGSLSPKRTGQKTGELMFPVP